VEIGHSSLIGDFMALQISKEQDTGITVSYWKVTGVVYDAKNDTIQVQVGGYKDQTARADNKSIILSMNFDANGTEFTDYFSDGVLATKSLLNACYIYLKTKSEFTSAVDV
jgi:hypothetical protein